MYIVDTTNEQQIQVEVQEVTSLDFKAIKKSKRFQFNWDKLRDFSVFKLVPAGGNDIAGLMALEHNEPLSAFEKGFTTVHLIESAKENVGTAKRYNRIAGCLLAYACRESFSKGYDGVVFLIPKTRLVQHYISSYGFQKAGSGLCLNTTPSSILINRYL